MLFHVLCKLEWFGYPPYVLDIPLAYPNGLSMRASYCVCCINVLWFGYWWGKDWAKERGVGLCFARLDVLLDNGR